MPIHREANATLLGRKILVVYDAIRRGPSLVSTKGRHNAQSMEIEGSDERPAFAVIDVKLHYVKER